ncbi:MAG: hypothetical protein ACK501_14640 [Planctomycetota bacterium]|jgi:hypothetical protein
MTTERDEGAAVHERARERLFAAEIAAALGVPVRAEDVPSIQRAGAGQWLLAALMLLGVGAAIGVGWLRHAELQEAQQPAEFDPVFPALAEFLPHAGPSVVVDDVDSLAALPTQGDAISVDVPSPVLAALGPRRGVRKIALGWKLGPSAVAESVAALRFVAALPDLESVHFVGGSLPPVQALRELRSVPRLHALMLGGDHRVVLDRALASALADLSHLRLLLLSRVPLTADGVHGLAGLPELEWLSVERSAYDSQVFAAFPMLRRLRALHLWSSDEPSATPGTLTAADMRALGSIPQLGELALAGFACDDSALAAIPANLQSLRLEHLRGYTPAGLRQLAGMAKLRSLHWIALTDSQLLEALTEVVRAAPLEQFFWAGGLLPAPMWRVLEKKTNLRSLTVQVGPDAADFAAHLVSYAKLERLRLFCRSLPESAEALRLQDLPLLRRLEMVPAPPLEKGSVDAFAERVRKLLGDRVVVNTW